MAKGRRRNEARNAERGEGAGRPETFRTGDARRGDAAANRRRIENGGEIIGFVERRDGDRRQGVLRNNRAVALRVERDDRGANRRIHPPPNDLNRREGRFVDVVKGPKRSATLELAISGAVAERRFEAVQISERRRKIAPHRFAVDSAPSRRVLREEDRGRRTPSGELVDVAPTEKRKDKRRLDLRLDRFDFAPADVAEIANRNERLVEPFDVFEPKNAARARRVRPEPSDVRRRGGFESRFGGRRVGDFGGKKRESGEIGGLRRAV